MMLVFSDSMLKYEVALDSLSTIQVFRKPLKKENVQKAFSSSSPAAPTYPDRLFAAM